MESKESPDGIVATDMLKASRLQRLSVPHLNLLRIVTFDEQQQKREQNFDISTLRLPIRTTFHSAEFPAYAPGGCIFFDSLCLSGTKRRLWDKRIEVSSAYS